MATQPKKQKQCALCKNVVDVSVNQCPQCGGSIFVLKRQVYRQPGAPNKQRRGPRSPAAGPGPGGKVTAPPAAGPASQIAPTNYGTQASGDTINVFAKKGDPYPAAEPVTQAFQTLFPDQRVLVIPVYAGENLEKASANEKQGEIAVLLPADLKSKTPFSLILWLDEDGVLGAAASLEDGTKLTVKITGTGICREAPRSTEPPQPAGQEPESRDPKQLSTVSPPISGPVLPQPPRERTLSCAVCGTEFTWTEQASRSEAGEGGSERRHASDSSRNPKSEALRDEAMGKRNETTSGKDWVIWDLVRRICLDRHYKAPRTAATFWNTFRNQLCAECKKKCGETKETRKQAREILERALGYDPNNEAAKRHLRELT